MAHIKLTLDMRREKADGTYNIIYRIPRSRANLLRGNNKTNTHHSNDLKGLKWDQDKKLWRKLEIHYFVYLNMPYGILF